MTVRVALAPDPEPRRSLKVATVAAMLDCNESDVRRLIRRGEIQAHRIGVRGVRVFLDSVEIYRERGAIIPTRATRVLAKSKIRSPASSAAFHEAMAGLRAKGII